MFTGQIMMIAGAAMIGISLLLMLVLAVVFAGNKKRLIRKIYGEIQESDDE